MNDELYMGETVKERLVRFLKYKGIGQAKFADSVGLSRGYVNNIRKSIQPDKIHRIAEIYPEMNTGWLLTGEGDMLKSEIENMAKNEELNELIKRIKYQYDLNQYEIASKIGVKGTYLSDVLNGRVNFNDKLRAKIYEVFSAVKPELSSQLYEGDMLKSEIENMDMNEEILLRIKRLMKEFCCNQTEFSKRTGIRQQNLSEILLGKRPCGEGIINKIVISLGVNKQWLLTGEGDMLKTESLPQITPQDFFTAMLLPISAQGGSLNDFIVSLKHTDCERVVTPIKNVDFVITVTGDSMAPDYPNGSQVLVKKVDENVFIEWGRVYVLDTTNGIIIKEVRKGDDEHVECYSLNPDPKYQPFPVRYADIYGMYRVLMVMSMR